MCVYKNNFIVLKLAIAVCFLLVSCSGNNNGNDHSLNDTTANSASATKTKKPDYNILERHLTLADKHLNGMIRAVTTTEYTISKVKDKENKQLSLKTIEHFDIDGFCTEANFSSPLSFSETIKFKYTVRGKLTEMNISGSHPSKNVFVYNNKGQQIEDDDYDSSGNIDSKTLINYNNDGDIIALTYKAKDTTVDSIIYNYPDNGKTKEATMYNKSGNIITRSITKYNDDLKVMMTYSTDSRGRITNKDTMIYDSKGNEIEHDILNANGLIQKKIVNKYDNSDRKTETSDYLFEGGQYKMIHSIGFQYDIHGNVVKEIELTSVSGKLTTTKIKDHNIENY